MRCDIHSRRPHHTSPSQGHLNSSLERMRAGRRSITGITTSLCSHGPSSAGREVRSATKSSTASHLSSMLVIQVQCMAFAVVPVLAGSLIRSLTLSLPRLGWLSSESPKLSPSTLHVRLTSRIMAGLRYVGDPRIR